MRFSMRILGLGTNLGRAARSLAQGAGRHLLRRPRAEGARHKPVQRNEARNALGKSGFAGRYLRNVER